MSLAIIPDELRPVFESPTLSGFLSDLPTGHEVNVTRNGADIAWIFTTEPGCLYVFAAVLSFYLGMGQHEEIIVTAREMGSTTDLRRWSSWAGHTI